MVWTILGLLIFSALGILIYLNKTPPKTIDNIVPFSQRIKTNTVFRYKSLILILLVYTSINFLIAEIILLVKTQKINNCLQKIDKRVNKIAVVTTDGRWGMLINKNVK